jgi:hypothetical protein
LWVGVGGDEDEVGGGGIVEVVVDQFEGDIDLIGM